MKTFLSPAKINWWLRVLDRRPDGFHNIETVFQEIDLHDTLEVEALAGIPECHIDGMPDEVPTESNLITKAWQLLRTRYPAQVGGVRFIVHKRIPMGGGLGGGSSNAATSLKAMAQIFELGLSVDELRILAGELGSDTAFFITGGCAIGGGRGEILEHVESPPPIPLVLVFPTEGVSTAWAYGQLSKVSRPSPAITLENFLKVLHMGDPSALAQKVHNDFELVVEREPWFLEARKALLDAGCAGAFLTGSGSTVVGILQKNESSSEIARTLQHTLSLKVHVTISGRPVGGL